MEVEAAVTSSQGAVAAKEAEAAAKVLKCGRTTSQKPIVVLAGKVLCPSYSQLVRNLSRDEGFGWGYYGAAPAQLALAVLLEVTYTEEALRLYLPFRNRFLGPMHHIGGEISVATIKSWLEDKRAEEARTR